MNQIAVIYEKESKRILTTIKFKDFITSCNILKIPTVEVVISKKYKFARRMIIMQKVRLTEMGLIGVKRRIKDDIYNIYTTEEVLTMDNVSENEKEAINETIEWGGVLGWIEATDSKKYNKIFVQIYEGDILEYVD